MSSQVSQVKKLSHKNYEEWSFVLEGYFIESGIDIYDLKEDKNGVALRLIRSTVSEEVVPFINVTGKKSSS